MTRGFPSSHNIAAPTAIDAVHTYLDVEAGRHDAEDDDGVGADEQHVERADRRRVRARQVELEEERAECYQQHLGQREALEDVVAGPLVGLQAHVQAHGDGADDAGDGELRGRAGRDEDDEAREEKLAQELVDLEPPVFAAVGLVEEGQVLVPGVLVALEEEQEEEHDGDPHGVKEDGGGDEGQVVAVVRGLAVDGEVRHQVPAPVVEGAAVDGLQDHAGDGRVDHKDDPEPGEGNDE